MREASLGYKHRIYFYMPVSGPSLITGCPCALSQAGCLGLLTVEERMLWLECCGVSSGEHSFQSWLIAGVSQPVKEIKWLLCVTWLQCYMPSHLLITRSFWKRSQTWNVGDIIIQLNVVALSHAILVKLSAASIRSVIHQSYPISATQHGVAEDEKCGRRCFPGELQASHAREITV